MNGRDAEPGIIAPGPDIDDDAPNNPMPVVALAVVALGVPPEAPVVDDANAEGERNDDIVG